MEAIQHVFLFTGSKKGSVKPAKPPKPPKGWDKEYPQRLDSLDPFFSKFHGKTLGEGKLSDRPRTAASKAIAGPTAKERKTKMLGLNLREAVNELTRITGEKNYF